MVEVAAVLYFLRTGIKLYLPVWVPFAKKMMGCPERIAIIGRMCYNPVDNANQIGGTHMSYKSADGNAAPHGTRRLCVSHQR